MVARPDFIQNEMDEVEDFILRNETENVINPEDLKLPGYYIEVNALADPFILVKKIDLDESVSMNTEEGALRIPEIIIPNLPKFLQMCKLKDITDKSVYNVTTSQTQLTKMGVQPTSPLLAN